MAVPSQQVRDRTWALGSVWPQRRAAFLGLATLVSLSRVYLGAHGQDLHVWGCGVANVDSPV